MTNTSSPKQANGQTASRDALYDEKLRGSMTAKKTDRHVHEGDAPGLRYSAREARLWPLPGSLSRDHPGRNVPFPPHGESEQPFCGGVRRPLRQHHPGLQVQQGLGRDDEDLGRRRRPAGAPPQHPRHGVGHLGARARVRPAPGHLQRHLRPRLQALPARAFRGRRRRGHALLPHGHQLPEDAPVAAHLPAVPGRPHQAKDAGLQRRGSLRQAQPVARGALCEHQKLARLHALHQAPQLF